MRTDCCSVSWARTMSSLRSLSSSWAALVGETSARLPCRWLERRTSSSCRVSSSTLATATDNSFSFSLNKARIESSSALRLALLACCWSTCPLSCLSLRSLSSCIWTRSRRARSLCSGSWPCCCPCWSWRWCCCLRNLSRCSLATSSCCWASICCCCRAATSRSSATLSWPPSGSRTMIPPHVAAADRILAGNP
uniref:Uncharacterized protein n=1 Tax=Ixodes ricinus TaxID=34613 RepID=A0A6B0V1Q0_IXORI